VRRAYALIVVVVAGISACGCASGGAKPAFDERAARDYWHGQYPDLPDDSVERLVAVTRDRCNDPTALREAAQGTSDAGGEDHEDVEQFAAACPALLDAAVAQ
jgi:hypothetical protein